MSISTHLHIPPQSPRWPTAAYLSISDTTDAQEPHDKVKAMHQNVAQQSSLQRGQQNKQQHRITSASCTTADNIILYNSLEVWSNIVTAERVILATNILSVFFIVNRLVALYFSDFALNFFTVQILKLALVLQSTSTACTKPSL